MKKRNIILLLIISIISISIWNCSSNGPKEMSVNIYLVAYEGSHLSGKTIGCNDVLVPVSKKVVVEDNEVGAALNELMVTKDTDELKNFIKGPSLLLYQVTVANGIADVYLKGDFAVSSVCDIPRIKEQLYQTAKQFQDIKGVNFFINDKTLEAYLSVSQEGFK